MILFNQIGQSVYAYKHIPRVKLLEQSEGVAAQVESFVPRASSRSGRRRKKRRERKEPEIFRPFRRVYEAYPI